MKTDYIIVGFGLAGMAFARELELNNKSFIVFEDKSQQSSLVAGGFYNPVILKRFTPVWNAQKQLEIALPFYTALENKFNTTYNSKIDIYRVFTSVEEQNDWFAASDKPVLSDYMHPEIIENTNTAIKAPFGFGKLVKTGKINVKKLLEDYSNYLSRKGKLNNSSFDYNAIEFGKTSVTYKGISASKIVFCEGFGLKKNPFFKDLPMQEAKGELLTIHAPKLNLEVMLKASIFVLPLENDLYKIGATFNWKDKTSAPTPEGKKELADKLKSIINVDFRVVEHIAGIRPTVKDRRPIIGKHHIYSQLSLLNGLGTRGVMLAPILAKQLYQHLECKKALPEEIAIDRFLAS